MIGRAAAAYGPNIDHFRLKRLRLRGTAGSRGLRRDSPALTCSRWPSSGPRRASFSFGA